MVRKASDLQVIDLLLKTPFSRQLQSVHGFVCSISMHILSFIIMNLIKFKTQKQLLV